MTRSTLLSESKIRTSVHNFFLTSHLGFSKLAALIKKDLNPGFRAKEAAFSGFSSPLSNLCSRRVNPLSLLRLHCADERAQELAVDMGGERVHVDAFGCEKLARIFGTIDSRRLDFDLLEAGGGELTAIVIFF